MYWMWYFLFIANPAFLLLGYTNNLGSEAKNVADDIMPVYGIVGAIAVVVFLVLIVIKCSQNVF